MKNDPALFSATELLGAYQRKTLSPVEVTKATLARIESLIQNLMRFGLLTLRKPLQMQRHPRTLDKRRARRPSRWSSKYNQRPC